MLSGKRVFAATPGAARVPLNAGRTSDQGGAPLAGGGPDGDLTLPISTPPLT
jgi:hypothetical protein